MSNPIGTLVPSKISRQSIVSAISLQSLDSCDGEGGEKILNCDRPHQDVGPVHPTRRTSSVPLLHESSSETGMFSKPEGDFSSLSIPQSTQDSLKLADFEDQLDNGIKKRNSISSNSEISALSFGSVEEDLPWELDEVSAEPNHPIRRRSSFSELPRPKETDAVLTKPRRKSSVMVSSEWKATLASIGEDWGFHSDSDESLIENFLNSKSLGKSERWEQNHQKDGGPCHPARRISAVPPSSIVASSERKELELKTAALGCKLQGGEEAEINLNDRHYGIGLNSLSLGRPVFRRESLVSEITFDELLDLEREDNSCEQSHQDDADPSLATGQKIALSSQKATKDSTAVKPCRRLSSAVNISDNIQKPLEDNSDDSKEKSGSINPILKLPNQPKVKPTNLRIIRPPRLPSRKVSTGKAAMNVPGNIQKTMENISDDLKGKSGSINPKLNESNPTKLKTNLFKPTNFRIVRPPRLPSRKVSRGNAA